MTFSKEFSTNGKLITYKRSFKQFLLSSSNIYFPSPSKAFQTHLTVNVNLRWLATSNAMALTTNDCTLLFYSKKILNVSYKETLMLGRLNLNATREDIKKCIAKYQSNVKDIDAVKFPDEYSEPLLEILGGEKIDSMDLSAYENATVLHDLNLPVGDELKNKYSVVIDGGTIEHVFNFPVAIKNSMEMLKVGGHYIGITPANNAMGHGFYQFSPELYFRVFSEENGFKIKKMLISVTIESETHWYEVADPKDVNNRVMLVNNIPVSLMIVAEKIAEKEIFAIIPQQLDYANTWNAHASLVENKVQQNESKIKFLYRKTVPKRLKIIFRNIYDIIFVEKSKNEFIGEFNPRHFIRTEI